jgi:hypothetical protein
LSLNSKWKLGTGAKTERGINTIFDHFGTAASCQAKKIQKAKAEAFINHASHFF